MGPARSVRLPWIDHLRTLAIVLVVHLHACVTYSHVGDWYVKSAREPTVAEKVPFISRRLDAESGVLRWLADRSFGVFVLHAPVLVALMMLFRGLPQHVYPLIAALTFAGLIASFALADVARRIPGVRSLV